MKENNHNISIALATYNGAKYLQEQLLSIINQTVVPVEIVIVDDCSTDGTIQIIEKIKSKYPFIKLLRNEVNKGPVKTFEIAISQCSCDYIALCDQDDIWESNKLEISIHELMSIEEENTPCMIFTDLQMIDSDGNKTGETFWHTQRLVPAKMDFYKTLFLNSVTGCTILLNKSMRYELTNIPKDVEMHDYWISLIALGFGRSKGLSFSTVNYRSHENSVTIKDEINLFKRLKKFINVLFQFDKDYMKSNFKQANLYLDIYGDRLNLEKRKQLINFVNLQNKNVLFRNLYIGFFKYFYIYS